MYFVHFFIFVFLLVRVVLTLDLYAELAVDRNTTMSKETLTAYTVGVSKGIIDPEKYSLESFEQDQSKFKKIYEEFVWSSELMSYQEWLIMNNFGVLSDTKESVFEKKTIERSRRSKKKFMHLVETGDILISSRSNSGLMGHAAIMVTDYWVLEMEGGKGWKKGIKNNNRQVSVKDWYDQNWDETTTVYRLPCSKKAEKAARWADRNYFNPYGGQDKEINVTYKITSDFSSKDPSYSSKLVLQAYYYGTRRVLKREISKQAVIAPVNIPRYFRWPYRLERIGKFQM